MSFAPADEHFADCMDCFEAEVSVDSETLVVQLKLKIPGVLRTKVWPREPVPPDLFFQHTRRGPEFGTTVYSPEGGVSALPEQTLKQRVNMTARGYVDVGACIAAILRRERWQAPAFADRFIESRHSTEPCDYNEWATLRACEIVSAQNLGRARGFLMAATVAK